MKHAFHTIYLCLALLSTACNGNDPKQISGNGNNGQDPEQPEPVVSGLISRIDVIQVVNDHTNGNNETGSISRQKYRFTYDARHRLTAMQVDHSADYNPAYHASERIELTYSSNGTVIYHYVGEETDGAYFDNSEETRTIQLDYKERMERMEWKTSDWDSDDIREVDITSLFSYDDAGCLQSVINGENGFGDSYCTWMDGNMTSVRFEHTRDHSAYTDRATYYTDRTNNMTNLDLNWLLYQTEFYDCLFGNDSSTIIFPLAGLTGKRSVGYVKTVEGDYDTGDSHWVHSYEYTFDPNDRPIEAVFTETYPDMALEDYFIKMTYTIVYE